MEIQVEFVNTCPLNCLHCSSIDFLNYPSQSIFPYYNALLKLIKLVKDKTHIYLSGGEPQTIHNLSEYIFHLTQFGAYVSLFTCGFYYSSYSKSLTSISYESTLLHKNNGLSSIYLSIFHKKSYIHDYITGQTNSLNAELETINNYIQSGVKVNVHLVLHNHNKDEIFDILYWLATLGVSEVRILRIISSGNARLHWSDIGISYKKQESIIEKIIYYKDRIPLPITVSGFPNLIPCRSSPGSIGCQAGIKLLYVTHSGYIYPCACTKSNPNFKIAHITNSIFIEQFMRSISVSYNQDCLNPPDQNIH
jgi:MoaA/NifB/PqqE/SkfB family radical SAM enzyme